MAIKPEPTSLGELAESLADSLTRDECDALRRHADQWGREQLQSSAMFEQLTETKQKLELLEKDRQWWQENLIKRRKAAASRENGRSRPRSRGGHR